LEEFIDINSVSGFNVGVSKTFLDNRGKIGLVFNDVFYGNLANGFIQFNNIRADFLQRNFSKNLRLTVSYNFGNTKLKKQRNRQTGGEEDANRVKTEKKSFVLITQCFL